MGQSIQEWTKENLWKTAFKYFKWYGLLKPKILMKNGKQQTWTYNSKTAIANPSLHQSIFTTTKCKIGSKLA